MQRRVHPVPDHIQQSATGCCAQLVCARTGTDSLHPACLIHADAAHAAGHRAHAHHGGDQLLDDRCLVLGHDELATCFLQVLYAPACGSGASRATACAARVFSCEPVDGSRGGADLIQLTRCMCAGTALADKRERAILRKLPRPRHRKPCMMLKCCANVMCELVGLLCHNRC